MDRAALARLRPDERAARAERERGARSLAMFAHHLMQVGESDLGHTASMNRFDHGALAMIRAEMIRRGRLEDEPRADWLRYIDGLVARGAEA